jgi:AAA domain
MEVELNNVAQNPLLQAPGLSSISGWVAEPQLLIRTLIHSPIPLAGECVVPREQRRRLTDEYQKIFVPTYQAMQIADRILSTLLYGLERRNPTWPEVQRWINSTQQWHGCSVDQIPWNPVQAKGIILEGMTGIGKSHIVERVLGLLPQVVDHEPKGDWGMLKLRQLVWLKVPMPADHSRRGLLASILAEMDRVLETDYYSSLVRSSNKIETLIVGVMQLLVQHRCGMLIIEEAQEANLGSKVFSRDFLNFFLRILNWGVPTMIVGNPLSFLELRMHAQDVDRFSEGGWFSMFPELGSNSSPWKKSWIPGLWQPSLLDVADAEFTPVHAVPEATDWASLLWQMTGGLPRQLARLRAEVMDWALLNNVPQVTTDLVFQVFVQSPRFSVVIARNRALANHDIKALMGYRDLPLEQLRQYWLKDSPMTIQPKPRPRKPLEHPLPAMNTGDEDESHAAAEQNRLIADLKSLTAEATRERKVRQVGKRKKTDVD